MTKLFITGATGYIGGDALYAISAAHPDLEITVLARNSDKGAKIASQYASIKLVYGDLDSTELLTTSASNADIVLHTANADNPGAATALIAGLALREKPGYLIHTSGTGILSSADAQRNTYGEETTHIHNDFTSISDVTSLPSTYAHRNVDKIILSASKDFPGKLHTAIVCPPCIYGPGRGPGNQRSVQIYDLAKGILTRGKGFMINGGRNVWHQVHVHDLSALYLALVSAAMAPTSSSATWNDQGYYFAENGWFHWGDISALVAKAAKAKGLIESEEVDSMGVEQAEKWMAAAGFLTGTNSRAEAVRARKVLGWAPKGAKMEDLVPEIVEAEARALGLIKGHAEMVAS